MKKFDPYKFVQEKKVLRPFDENGEKDGTWNYMHETDVWTLIKLLQTEQLISISDQYHSTY